MKAGCDIPKRVSILILGAGLTGLSSGYHIGDNCLVVDAASNPGGTSRTIQCNGFYFDYGAHVLRFKAPWTREWIVEELRVPLVKRKENCKILINGRLVSFPGGFRLSDLSRLIRQYNEKILGVGSEQVFTGWIDGFLPETSMDSVLETIFLNDPGKDYWYPEKGGIGAIAESLAARIPNLVLNLPLKSLDLLEKKACFDGSIEIQYNKIISTIPLDVIAGMVIPHHDEISLPASKLRFNPVNICNIMLKRPNVMDGLHWIYCPDADIPFYRVSMPHNIGHANCPKGCSSLSIEFGGTIDNKSEIETKSKEILIRMGLMDKSEINSEAIWSELNHGHVIYTEDWFKSRNEVISSLRKHDIICVGSYGRWECSNIESALIQGKEIKRRLNNQNKIKSQTPISYPVQSDSLQRYFDSRYPGRFRIISRFFRRRESERLSAIQNWLPHCEGLRMLDVGCGDGLFISKLIRGVAGFIRIEDFVASKVIEAQKKLAHQTDYLEAAVTDSRDSQDDSLYDVVLAIGLFDYYENWDELLQMLLNRTDEDGVLIIDFPKSNNLHSFIRKIWLDLNRVGYHCTDKDGLLELMDSMGLKSEISELSVNWVVRIRKAPQVM